jgi:general secretion pathway protein N
MKRSHVALLCAAAVGTVFVARAPALWLGLILKNNTQGTVQFKQSWGTVWAGSALIQINRSAAETMVLPDAVAWRLDCLNWAPLSCKVELRSAASPAPIELLLLRDPAGNAEIRLKSGQFNLPTDTLNTLGAPFNTLKLGGLVTLSWPAFTQALSPEVLSGKTIPSVAFELKLQQLRSALTQNTILGDYRLSAVPNNNAWNITLITEPKQAALLMTGSGVVGLNTQPIFELRSKAADPGSQPRLAALLNFLGRRQGDSHVLSLR